MRRPARFIPPMVLAVAIAAMLSSSCGFLNKRRLAVGRSTSLGAELHDLQRALDAGAITEDEYRTVKSSLERERSRALYPVAEDDR